jgi:hypothetical protein
MNKFTRDELRTFRDDFDVAVKGLKKKYGVEVELGNISFSPSAFRSKIEVTRSVSSDGSKIDIELEKFKKDARSIGVNEGLYGKKFSFSGRKFKVTGLKPRSPKFPIIAEEVSTGKSYKLPMRSVSSL